MIIILLKFFLSFFFSIINFNPAISTGLLVTGVLSPWMYVPYIAMQCLGSVVGAVIAQVRLTCTLQRIHLAIKSDSAWAN